MAASIFSYNAQRPYPYRWFTPVALLGGTVFVVLFTIMNFVNNSYILETQNTKNPNATIENGIWFRNWPSYLTRRVQPLCQPQELFVKTQFFTNQTGFVYTLLRVSQRSFVDNLRAAPPSMSYLNNILEHCEIYGIQMSFEKTTSATSYSVTDWKGSINAKAACKVWGPAGKTNMLLSATYNPLPDFFSLGSYEFSYFIATDPISKPALFWAQTLLNGFWKQAAANISELADGSTNPITSGYINVFPGSLSQEITSPGFFWVDFTFSTKNGTMVRGPINSPRGVQWSERMSILEYYDGLNAYISPSANLAQFWTSVDTLAKIVYSAVMTDLGRVDLPHVNLLTNNTHTHELLSQIIDAERADAFAGLPFYSSDPSLSWKRQAALARLHENDQPLTPSVISTSYRCEIPKLKSGGEIFISILIANLVLLSATWQLFVFGVGWLALERVPEAHFCKGCLKITVDAEEETEQLPKTARVSTISVAGSHISSTNSIRDREE